ncbi:unnamed protein product [Sphenostylis stenocarpa]|uniref:Uncharacterized protein n=1 Tax=Sphenostylis stenocarpa TaxID=92480 RepID=A0AA86S333_9FABA|nr:unnamed protein product [Sphenostylis stenocarpa]
MEEVIQMLLQKGHGPPIPSPSFYKTTMWEFGPTPPLSTALKNDKAARAYQAPKQSSLAMVALAHTCFTQSSNEQHQLFGTK